MREHDDFRFTASSAAFYAWVEQADPAMFDEIRARVAEGRWEIVGGWWIEPDCHIPCGESFVRQALYGQHFFREKFGVTARTGFNVDSFGHNAMLPQILKKSGLDYYIFMRPSAHEKGLPGSLFWWEAGDGSRVLAFRIPFEYCTWGKGVEEQVRRCAGEIRAPIEDSMGFYGVGNHGGGPTIENIESIRRLDAQPELPRLTFSTTRRFFEAVQAKNGSLPVVHDELPHHASGCYAAHSGIKRWNRRAENALLRAEKWAAVAQRVTGAPYPAELAHAWKNVLFNQFHDILGGTSLPDAYEDAQHLYGEAMAVAGRSLNSAIQSLAWHTRVPAEPGTRPIAVYNAHAWAVRQPVELEVGGLQETDGLLDDEGRPVPMQRIQSHTAAGGRARIAFLADLPPLGYRVYRLCPGAAQAWDTPLQAGETWLENGRLRLTFDAETGYLTSLFDKQAQVEALLGPAARPVVIDDRGDTWGHHVYRYGPEAGAFTATRMRVVECGPVQAVLRVESAYGASRLVQDFLLYRDLDYVEVRAAVDWHHQFKVLKLRFPVGVNFMQVTHEIPYGSLARCSGGDEEPMQSWVDVSGVARVGDVLYGLSVLNDGKYSVDVNIRTIGLTVLRSPVYAHHVPTQPDPTRDHRFMDQGMQQFTYSLLPHADSWSRAGTVRRAAEMNQPLVALLTTYRPEGALPPAASFLDVDAPNVNVTVLKKAEHGDDLILRAYETAGCATRAALRLPAWDRTIDAGFGPYEIKTFRIPADAAAEAVETNLIEDELPR